MTVETCVLVILVYQQLWTYNHSYTYIIYIYIHTHNMEHIYVHLNSDVYVYIYIYIFTVCIYIYIFTVYIYIHTIQCLLVQVIPPLLLGSNLVAWPPRENQPDVFKSKPCSPIYRYSHRYGYVYYIYNIGEYIYIYVSNTFRKYAQQTAQLFYP